jgi:hypothetical protein
VNESFITLVSQSENDHCGLLNIYDYNNSNGQFRDGEFISEKFIVRKFMRHLLCKLQKKGFLFFRSLNRICS